MQKEENRGGKIAKTGNKRNKFLMKGIRIVGSKKTKIIKNHSIDLSSSFYSGYELFASQKM